MVKARPAPALFVGRVGGRTRDQLNQFANLTYYEQWYRIFHVRPIEMIKITHNNYLSILSCIVSSVLIDEQITKIKKYYWYVAVH